MSKKRRIRTEEEIPVVQEEAINETSTTEEEPVEKTPVQEEVKEEPKKEFRAKVTGVDILNIRNTPNGNIMEQVRRGNILKVVDQNPLRDDSAVDWIKIVSPSGNKAWVMAKYLFVYEDGDYKEV